MFLLALDTTLLACSAAIWDSVTNMVVAQRQLILGRGHGEAIGPMVQELLHDAGLNPEQIGRIAVTCGPGTFTGIRIGLSLAHGMATALGCAVVGINTLAATAAPLMGHHDVITVVQEAGATGKFYAARFERGMDLQKSNAAVVFATLEECVLMCRGAVVIGTGADAVMAEAPLGATRVLTFDLPSAALFASVVASFSFSGDLPQPLYLREPDAKPAATVAAHMVTRSVTPEDLPRLAVLHAMAFDQGWTVDSFQSALALPGAGALVVVLAQDVRGFVQFQTVAGETEINTICVEPRWRKRGLARHLLQELKRQLVAAKAEKIHLDVAEDNHAALGLYRGLGFADVGRRKGYYARRDGDAVAALLMSLTL